MAGFYKSGTFLDDYYLGRLPDHIWIILGSAVTCHILTALSRRLMPLLAGRFYTSLDAAKKTNWDIRIVSLIHAVLICWLAYPLLSDPVLNKDRVFGYTEYSAKVHSIACGYFLWDSFISLIYYKEFGPAFLFHGVACFLLYLMSFGPFLMAYGCVFLMFEASTPFLNLHWFMDKTGLTGSWLQFFNGLILAGTFFLARNVWGGYMSYYFVSDLLTRRNEIPTFHFMFYGILDVMMNLLNAFWLTKVVSAVMRRFKQDKKKRQ